MSGFSDLQSAAQAFSAAARPSPKKSKRRYTPPFSLRLTVEERKRLDELAGNQPLGSYIRNRILGEQTEKRRKVKKPTPDTALLALVLGEFGRSRLASNINQLAKAANIGTLDVTPETEREIVQACAEIQAIRTLLITALGVAPVEDE
ncbi:hypothetical protein SAMN05216428_10797 [Nitrosospira sp. Nsp11]|uniref:MobC family plasmid mobilization relaxosome protein n=1 Tax=Nitrosospira sp. Nsp11 TaxID=1855338 RepID=UPI0009177B84|nr:MobC family plasmid mobilization relaxosome protein [Nitrosospira sp. Nsp11]SHL85368.1 hypothetical protein SAMN05216428_10797 [Nitrosospira sp. Nsp11]